MMPTLGCRLASVAVLTRLTAHVIAINDVQ